MTFDDDAGFEDLIPADPYDAVPNKLKVSNSWLVYRLEPGAGTKKNKIPYDPTTRRKANDPSLGVPFEVAKAIEKEFSGLGHYVEPPLSVIDLDNCVDSKTGDVAPWASEIVHEVNSYTEASPSGTGLHIWVIGVKPGDKCRKGIEIYSSKRYMTVTGIHVSSTPKEIREVDLTSIYNRMLAGEFEEPQKVTEVQPQIKAPVAEVHQSGTVITTKLELLMHGTIRSTKPFEISDDYGNNLQYPSQSEADGALAVLLAFKFDGDVEKMDSEFRVSSLYRSKFDRIDYRDATLKSAVAFYKKSKQIEAPPNTSQVIAVANEDDESIIDIETKLPDFPQFTGSLADLCNAMSPDIPFEFKFCSALVHFGMIRSGVDGLSAEPHLQSRFYCALIAPPGRGKTAAINEVTKIMRSLSNKYQTFSSIDSAPALIDAFAEQTRASIIKADGTDNLTEAVMAKIVLSPDELTDLFEKSKVTANSRNSMASEMLKLFESTVTGNRVRGAKIKLHLENAHLAILGGATESGFGSMWTGVQGASGGLQSRFVIVSTENRKMPSMQRPPDLERLTQVTQTLIEQVKQPSFKYEFDQDAFRLYDKWWTDKGREKTSETRVDGIVKRLLIVLARTNNVEMITEDLVSQGIALGDYLISARERFMPLDASTWTQAEENFIIAVYQKQGLLTQNQCRKLVHPERRPGGIGPFISAFKNLTMSGILKVAEKTQRSEIFRLNL